MPQLVHCLDEQPISIGRVCEPGGHGGMVGHSWLTKGSINHGNDTAMGIIAICIRPTDPGCSQSLIKFDHSAYSGQWSNYRC